MIVSHGGVHSDVSEDRLPADAIPALGAYSLTRKLRKLYNGDLFQYRQGSDIREFPSQQVDSNIDAYLVRIYDQKTRHGLPAFDAVQTDNTKQPLIRLVSGVNVTIHFEAVFSQGQCLDITGLGGAMGRDFTITARGNGGGVPRPMIGVWGATDEITIEPSDLATRFTYNLNLGTIADIDGETIQCFSGENVRQNGKRVLSINGQSSGHITTASTSYNFNNASIGRSNERYYEGTFTEATFHLGDLTSIGAHQVYNTMRDYYGN